MKFPWRHGQSADRLAQTAVSTAGQIYVEEDTGRSLVGDGVTVIGSLPRGATVSDLSNYASLSEDGTEITQGDLTVPIGGGGGGGGSGVSFGTDSNGFDTIILDSGSSASFGTDANGFDTLVLT